MKTLIIDFKGTQKQAERYLKELYRNYNDATEISCINMPLFADFGIYTFKILIISIEETN